ncbi:glycosyltransferase [Catalinimonas niigatensis]|uniref:glycosyltransferase n=1 Tax=Catalinimonas niigatensis TaxID=1397264 RepID=UPI00266524FD|nr:glycosyltransferase [Catalinimonas niigatensis]WPP48887.1 glycosyltransferase [Catalinimonas niigatensis]
MVIVISLLTLFYCILTVWLWYHWQKITVFDPADSENRSEKVSVIIPIRNEAKTILSLLEDIDHQSSTDGSHFSPQQLEVIVVDDQSEDDSVALVESYKSENFQLHLLALELPEKFVGSHKKLAISQAIASAQGDIIMTTDGDCHLGPQWITTILHFLRAQNAVMVSAPVTFEQGKTRFEQLQLIEFASLIGAGAACMQAGIPNMCNGANLTFTKKAFLEVKGYEGSMHIPSGDDEFLMQKLHQRYPGQIYFLKNKEAVVHTAAQKSIKHFYHQRKRWAGKWKLHKSITTALLALGIFTFHALFIAACILTLTGAFPWKILLFLVTIKGIAEFVFLENVLNAMDKKLSILNFLVLQLIYSPYAVFFGIVANFGGYQWKERKYM